MNTTHNSLFFSFFQPNLNQDANPERLAESDWFIHMCKQKIAQLVSQLLLMRDILASAAQKLSQCFFYECSVYGFINVQGCVDVLCGMVALLHLAT